MDRQPKILCVDDEAICLTVFEAVWEPHGCQTVLVQSGHDALATLRQERIDLVILDVVMPGMK
jgi:two-component system sensor histidine kinase BarA